MSKPIKKYWKGLEELNNDPDFQKYQDREFPENLPVNADKEDGNWERRDFLKMMGFSVAAASLAACEAPVRKAIPYLNKPVDVDPGIPNYYASTYSTGGDYCSIVVKTREGRPIKIQGNELSKISWGGVNAQVEGSVLTLYDEARLRGPFANGSGTDWGTVDSEIKSKLNGATSIRIVSNTILSPTTQAAIDLFKAKYPNAVQVVYDSQSAYGIRKAYQDSFGKDIIPAFDFSNARVIVSLDADFLGTWLSPIEFSNQYARQRKLGDGKNNMSRHYQFESNLSLTGANADYRTGIRPSQSGLVTATLYNMIAGKAGASRANTTQVDVRNLQQAADELWANRGSSLVVSGSNDPAVQIMVNAINDLLGNYGNTIDLNTACYHRMGDDTAMDQFIADVGSGSVDAVVFFNCNPVYDHSKGAELASNLGKVGLKISTNEREDETSVLCDYLTPDHHYLEAWNDALPKDGHYSLAQPTINPLFNTRHAGESFLIWAENDVTDYYTFLQSQVRNKYGAEAANFQAFWDKILHDGLLEVPNPEAFETASFSANFSAVENAINSNYSADQTGFELVLYQKVGIGSGNQANNPFLHELPDPITKVTWDNYITMSQADANDLGIAMVGDRTQIINLTVQGKSIQLPVVIQPGQAKGTLGLALGYGRRNAGIVANEVGVDAYPLMTSLNGTLSNYVFNDISVEVTDDSYRIARTQTHQTYMNRDFVVQESVLSEYQKDPSAGRHKPQISTWTEDDHKLSPGAVSLWKGHKYDNHHWGMVVDMNSCTGCSACLVACNVENNIPVVGKDEILNRREMHWLRIDRYYSSDADEDDRRGLENPSENPEVTFQPLMCQHCNNAPCETVCPVAATTHSTEGLNQMAYNRCIGTRYCANNCPYKVRRFNWFKYHDNKQFDKNTTMNSDLGKMVLNPDVVVRSRGVMEKCSLCVQRIQYGKLEAKKEKRRPIDGEINTACAQACPTNAILFGDMLDPNSRISKFMKFEETDEGITVPGEARAYTLLEEVGTKPNVYYLTKIRNKTIA